MSSTVDSDWREAVLDMERRGELLSACDLAEHALEEHPADVWLQHRVVLALARASSTREAARRFEAYGLGAVEDEDVAALGARIAKDLALEAGDVDQIRRAAEGYEAIFRRTSGYYPAINAASLELLAGNSKLAHELAAEARARASSDDSYYGVATVAEAELILGDEDAAHTALTTAAQLHGGDHAALATTRRQLRLVCDANGIDQVILAALAGPAVVHFCGHRISAADSARFPSAAEQAIKEEIAAAVTHIQPGYAYGALASGGDILWAEALLSAGCEVHVVLPFNRAEFVTSSVADSGEGWVERFERCIAAAAQVTYATEDAFLADDVLYRYGSELAMGLALLRARYLDAGAHQLAVWDGQPARGEAGTAIDVATWARTGRPATLVSPRGPTQTSAAPTRDPAGAGRVVRALLFGDIRGFASLADDAAPRFNKLVLGSFANVLDRFGGNIEHRNTWGDAIYVVLDEATAAAACADELQGAMASIDLRAARLPDHLALRLAAHVGPVFPIHDPVTGTASFMGSHVSRTARIEPVTPPGAVYATEPFAAALELAGSQYTADYVGHLPAAKDYGRLRMHRLRATRRGALGSQPLARGPLKT